MNIGFRGSRGWESGHLPLGHSYDANLGESIVAFGRRYGVVDCDFDDHGKLKKYPFLPDGVGKGKTVNQLGRVDYAMDTVAGEIAKTIRLLIDHAIREPDLTQDDRKRQVDYVERELLNSAALDLDELLLLNEMLAAYAHNRLDEFVKPANVSQINRLIKRFGLGTLTALNSTGGGPVRYDLAPCYLVLNAYRTMTEADKKGKFRRMHLPNQSMTAQKILRTLQSNSRFTVKQKEVEADHGSFSAFLNHIGSLSGGFFPIYMEQPSTDRFEQSGGFFLAPEAASGHPDMRSYIPFSHLLFSPAGLNAPHRIDASYGSVRFPESGVTSTEWHSQWRRVSGNTLA